MDEFPCTCGYLFPKQEDLGSFAFVYVKYAPSRTAVRTANVRQEKIRVNKRGRWSLNGGVSGQATEG